MASDVQLPTPENPAELRAVRRAFLDALLAGDAIHARHVIDQAVTRGAAIDALYLRVLGPALEDVGTMWSAGELSVAQEHHASAVAGGIMHRLADRWRRPPVSGRLALVACSPGERHALGAQMLGDFLEAAGWEVVALGADTPADDLAVLAGLERPDLVALSTAIRDQLPGAADALAALNRLQPRPFLVVGGRAWFDLPEQRARDLGADARVLDPVELIRLLAERFPALADEDA